jgi:hypothetical protein
MRYLAEPWLLQIIKGLNPFKNASLIRLALPTKIKENYNN